MNELASHIDINNIDSEILYKQTKYLLNMTNSNKYLSQVDECEFIEISARNLVNFLDKQASGKSGCVNNNAESKLDWTWEMSERIAELIDDTDIKPEKMQGFDMALRVKHAIRKRLKSDLSESDRLEIFEWFVKDYGKVTQNRNLKAKILEAQALAASYQVDTGFKVKLDGISTISKCLTLYEERMPIYDSRVAFALNSINYVSGDRDRYLRGPDGRNASIDIIDIRAQFLIDKTDRLNKAIEKISKGGKQRANHALKPISFSPGHVYGLWCQILAKSSGLLNGRPGTSIDDLEILLFAHAPTTCVLELLKKIRDEKLVKN